MDTITSIKELSSAQTPLLLFDVELNDGSNEKWSTHEVTVDGESYAPRVARHNFFEVQASSPNGIDAIPRVSISLANADSHFSQIETASGFKGARVSVGFVFYDLALDAPASERRVVFRGILNPPDEMTEDLVRLTAVNRMNMQRVLLPPVRIQRRCPWTFPATPDERAEAAGGGSEGRFSRTYHCGYSAGEAGGVGNLNGSEPFTTCSYTRADCVARGMFDHDSGANVTRRFGGIEFVPASILVRGHGSKNREASALAVNEARYNDFVPLAYGTVWLDPPVVFARNDGNLTRMEVVLTAGEVASIRKVVVNNVEIPLGVSGSDMTASGWWNLFASGRRTGGFNLNFTDSNENPLGDPYGNMAALSVVVPNQIHDGGTLPRVKVLLDGIQVEEFGPTGGSLGYSFSRNPSWVLLDVLRRCGWRVEELDLPSFARAAATCDETIAATDNSGNPISVRRFECNLLIRGRRTAADVIRSIRNGARLQLTYLDDGRLSVLVENTLLLQQPVKPDGSNASSMTNGGWPAYRYVDGSDPSTGSAILRRSDGTPSIRLWSNPIADTPNRFSVEFADQFNEYQQDSLALTDVEDVKRTGQEITGRLVADGLTSFDHTARVLKYFLDRSLKGNRYIQFDTTVKALGQRVGDIITVTYLKEGLLDQPFRVLKIEPGMNYRTVRLTAQIHDDEWYNDTNGQLTLMPATERLPLAEPSVPSSLYGDERDEQGEPRFSVRERLVSGSDGAILAEVAVGFNAPSAGQSFSVGIPTVSLQPTIQSSGGSLPGGSTFYYAVTATDTDSVEGNPSFVVRAEVPSGSSTNAVTLSSLRFHGAAVSFSVYRGSLPSRLFRIASGQDLADQFTDSGFEPELEGAPDPHFDHANFYWRFEDVDEYFASEFGPTTIGSSNLSMEEDEFAGHAVRILRGKGAGQERKVTSNTATTFSVEPAWASEPDESSVFVAAENTWHFAGRARTSPARFQVPNLRDRVIQITGRSANAQNVESLEGLAILTRWRIGGGGLGVADTGLPPTPSFALSAPGDGSVLLSGLGFETLENTQSITSGLVRLHYRDEVSGESGSALSSAIDETAEVLQVSHSSTAAVGDMLQLGTELVRLVEVASEGTELTVARGQADSLPIAHDVGTTVRDLRSRTETISFRRNFFGTPESATWAHTIWLPCSRVSCAEVEVSNAFGASAIGVAGYSEFLHNGIRTLHGGQFSLQVEGALGIVNDAAPSITVQDDLSIRDVFATLKQAPVGADVTLDIRQDGDLVGSLTIPADQTLSVALGGATLPVLRQGATLSLDISGVGTQYPGSNLSVTVRV